MKRVIIIVLDGVGVGELPDARLYGDEGSNTLANTLRHSPGIALPNLAALGLGHIVKSPALHSTEICGSYGTLNEQSPGKDTVTGHWELMGVTLDKPFRTFPHGFPEEIVAEFEKRIGRKSLGNVVASGTEILKQLGDEHVRTGYPIVYTSADSVFQIACHEEVVPPEELYSYCSIARQILTGDHLVARVIARPFIGAAGKFTRTPGRKDFAVKPPSKTVLDSALLAGKKVLAVGKIEDIFAGQGISESIHTTGNAHGAKEIVDSLEWREFDILMANLVDFDMLWGHRNDPHGFARALSEFDQVLPQITSRCRRQDLLIITSDHGCDPTTVSTDHSREYAMLLTFGQNMKSGVDLGTRQSFADVGASVGRYLEFDNPGAGHSFMDEIRK